MGNLAARVDEPTLRKLFARYGRIEEVDIKLPHEGSDAVYCFIQFENLDQSQEAKYYEVPPSPLLFCNRVPKKGVAAGRTNRCRSKAV